MFDVNDDAKGEFRRVEVLTGPSRRRRWSAEQKARIVAESYAERPQPMAYKRRNGLLCFDAVFTANSRCLVAAACLHPFALCPPCSVPVS